MDENQFEALQVKEEIWVGDKYKYLFSSPMGREVLADILAECHFGTTLNPDNKVQIAEYNVGIMILAKCGILGPITRTDVINALCNVTPKTKEVEK